MGQVIMNCTREKLVEELVGAVLEVNAGADVAFIIKALFFACDYHDGQSRDEGVPYIFHPFRVALYLVKKMHVTDVNIIAAALLHDVLEDCPGVTFEDIKQDFNQEVAEITAALTKLPPGGRLTMEERKNIYLTRIKNSHEKVIMIKIADRQDNLRTVHLSPKPGKYERYIRETKEFYLPLAKEFFPECAQEMELQINWGQNLKNKD